MTSEENNVEKIMNEDLSEYNHPESIISLLSPVSWLQMDEIKINSDFNLNSQNGYVKKKSERIIKELTYELCQAKALNLHSKLSNSISGILMISIIIQIIVVLFSYFALDFNISTFS
ncbi:Uncharacterized protein cpbgf_3003583 [Cryptosporidium parvum]|uniref:Uncharacterized protein n=1 Tax=Cryptosporidium parvum TaxID=5807 RepID=A0A7S7LIE2_CRYPV|nr:Uncharacterized protein CPATCC_0034590 [Cryptosporidium parvum]WRK31599.1 Uncharacterized protein cpbgf_3003583 [Cryptosporidium parvum]|eukprot:QOY42710.1 hypothetical protein CPATCC_001381 [Cryptosporidium parvum]